MIERQQMIDRLVGVKSSKRNYYTALKNSVSELQRKIPNWRLLMK